MNDTTFQHTAERISAAAGRFSRGPLWRRPRELDDPGMREEQVRQLGDARLVFADHRLLQHDFPWLRDEELVAGHDELRVLSEPERHRAIGRLLDRWLLERSAFISQTQAEQTRVNESIPVAGAPRKAFRPTRYGRALVISLDDLQTTPGEIGLLDIKGAGVAPGCKPDLLPYRSGLCYLGDALADTLIQWVIDAIFSRAAPGFFTVPVYGVIDTGFCIRNPEGDLIPAGILVRRAHRRPRYAMELPESGSTEERVKFQIEMVLRRYGLSSNNGVTCIEVEEREGQLQVSYGRQPAKYGPRGMKIIRDFFGKGPGKIEGINVQIARECGFKPSFAHLVDFGHYRIARDFHHPVASLVRDRMVFFGGAIMPESPHFVRPHPRLALPFEDWGEEAVRDDILPARHLPFNRTTRVFARAYALARQFSTGELSGPQVLQGMADIVTAVIRRW